MTRVAIVGGGIAGLGAASRLAEAGLDVLILDAADVPGGNCFPVAVRGRDGQTVHIDAGVSDFNRATFVELGRLLRGLGLPLVPIAQDASFMATDRTTAWFTHGGQVRTLRVPHPDRFQTELLRFKREVVEVLDDPQGGGLRAGEYLARRGYSASFRRLAYAPRAQGCFAMPEDEPERFPLRELVAFWKIHGLVGDGPADRVCVAGGMHRYVPALLEWLSRRGARLASRTRVVGVKRRAGHLEVRAVGPDGAHATHVADHVILALEPAQIPSLLEDAPAEDRLLFAEMPYQRARVVVHGDERLLPADREAWGAFNYLVPDEGAAPAPPTMTVWTNRLQSLPASVPDVFVTINPRTEPAPDTVVAQRFVVHPVADGRTAARATRVARIQGRNRIWFAGGSLQEPWVHEPALVTGLRSADAIIALEQQRSAARRRLATSPTAPMMATVPPAPGLLVSL